MPFPILETPSWLVAPTDPEPPVVFPDAILPDFAAKFDGFMFSFFDLIVFWLISVLPVVLLLPLFQIPLSIYFFWAMPFVILLIIPFTMPMPPDEPPDLLFLSFALFLFSIEVDAPWHIELLMFNWEEVAFSNSDETLKLPIWFKWEF